MRKFKCINKCLCNGNLYYEGDIIEADKAPNKHFEAVEERKVEVRPKVESKQKTAPVNKSKPATGVMTGTTEKEAPNTGVRAE